MKLLKLGLETCMLHLLLQAVALCLPQIYQSQNQV